MTCKQETEGGENLAKFRFATDGFTTIAEIDGKGIGRGIHSVDFRHTGGEKSRLILDIDVEKFSFMADGDYDQAESAMMSSQTQQLHDPKRRDQIDKSPDNPGES